MLSFGRLVSNLRLSEDIPSTALPDNFYKSIRNQCFDEAEQRCRVSGDYLALIAASAELERQEVFRTGPETEDPETDVRERTAIEKCARFELQFDNAQTSDYVVPLGAQRLSVATVVPLRLPEDWVAPLNTDLEGEAPLTYTEISSRPNCFIDGCSYNEVVSTNPSTAKVRRGKLSFGPFISVAVWSLGEPKERTGTFDVEFNDGQPTEVINILVRAGSGFINPGPTSQTVPYWSNFFSLLHQDELGSEPDWLRWNRDWTTDNISYPVMFERRLDRTSNEFTGAIDLNDSTVVRLVHKPAPLTP